MYVYVPYNSSQEICLLSLASVFKAQIWLISSVQLTFWSGLTWCHTKNDSIHFNQYYFVSGKGICSSWDYSSYEEED